MSSDIPKEATAKDQNFLIKLQEEFSIVLGTKQQQVQTLSLTLVESWKPGTETSNA